MPSLDSGYIADVRVAKKSDATDAAALLRDSIRELCAADHANDEATLGLWLSNKNTSHLEQWILEPTNHVVVVHHADLMVGLGLLHRSSEVQLCYVRPGHTRRGIGQLVISALETQALHWGLHQLKLTSTHHARAFYERLGYVADGPAQAVFSAVVGYPYKKLLPEVTDAGKL